MPLELFALREENRFLLSLVVVISARKIIKKSRARLIKSAEEEKNREASGFCLDDFQKNKDK